MNNTEDMVNLYARRRADYKSETDIFQIQSMQAVLIKVLLLTLFDLKRKERGGGDYST